jgi:coenzyme F420-reducing hydrogenase beta subunit
VPVLTVYGKPGCHLCDDARAAVRDVLAGRDVGLREVDVTLDPVLERRYGERIPVVALDGEELFDYVVDADALRERLDKVDA